MSIKEIKDKLILLDPSLTPEEIRRILSREWTLEELGGDYRNLVLFRGYDEWKAAQHPSVTEDILLEIVNSEDWEAVVEALQNNKLKNTETLCSFAQHEFDVYRIGVAYNINTPMNILCLLMADKNENVREAAIEAYERRTNEADISQL